MIRIVINIILYKCPIPQVLPTAHSPHNMPLENATNNVFWHPLNEGASEDALCWHNNGFNRRLEYKSWRDLYSTLPADVLYCGQLHPGMFTLFSRSDHGILFTRESLNMVAHLKRGNIKLRMERVSGHPLPAQISTPRLNRHFDSIVEHVNCVWDYIPTTTKPRRPHEKHVSFNA